MSRSKKHFEEVEAKETVQTEFEIVLVYWNDSTRWAIGWGEVKDSQDIGLHTVATVGFVVEDGEKHLTLSGSVCEGKCHDLFVIPVGCIIERTSLGIVKLDGE